ncbi:choice-of-anchor Q domain-containing protein [Nocardioides jejuensis]|uniref:CSLREA domain-containing protein n=1 Tax=Nocardioides jejuensis TaxID=2502782 RepID=A0A4R1CK48_9ACTN|nr:choice-of-anchor Q domain-containing protein [Nocardioides jejuensis]TCJ30775.1 hypothetical protein EPD65_01695 [Nocardioides jejuensis]
MTMLPSRRFLAPLAAAAFLVGPAVPTATAATGLTFRVTTTADQIDARPGDGVCRTAAGTCSLRAAMIEADFHPTQRTTIQMPAGHFTITRGPLLPIVNASPSLAGPFMVLSNVTVRGAGARQTVIDGNGLDRIFTVAPPWVTLDLSDVTLTGGIARERELVVVTGGGAIANQGHLVLHRVTVQGNRADYGGGIFNTPSARAEIYDSSILDNIANREGGGIRFDAAGTLVNSTVARNRVLASCCPGGSFDGSLVGEGGGIDTRGAGPVTIISSTIVDNHAATGGGGLNAATGYQGNPGGLLPAIGGKVTVRNTVIARNTSDSGAANCKHTVAPLVSLGHNLEDASSCPFTAVGDVRGTDPQLVGPADFGGPTDTYLPAQTSPLLAAATAGPAYDQRGVPRPASCTIGAVEGSSPI